MRILYLYTKFYDGHGNECKYRGYDEVSLNFSRDYHYRAEKSGKHSVKLTREKLDAPVPEGFWGDRVYNATALVGDNGSGKSSLLYSMLDVCLNQPHTMEFILLLERDDRENPLLLYTNMSVETDFQVYSTLEYPIDLLNTKFMFLDNSLSMNSVEYSEKFGRLYENYPGEQLFNASLAASMFYSNYISAVGRTQRSYPISEQIKTHFRYESYQEVRCVFNQSFRDILLKMRENGNPVPIPEKLVIGIDDPADILRDGYSYISGGIILKKYQAKKNFIFLDDHSTNIEWNIPVQLSANCLANCVLDFIRDHSSVNEAMERIDDLLFSGKSPMPTRESCLGFIEWFDVGENICSAYRDFINYIWDNEYFIRENFHNLGKSHYSIDVGSEETDAFMTGFIEKYRPISSDFYFLTFDWRMSSGECNLLRTYAKFRYLLDGPSFSNDPQKYKGERKTTKLVNKIEGINYTCDSLVVMLDEADLTYHPEWQRQFMMALTDFLPELFTDPYSADMTDGCKDIQIILATHSPLMLGDFPSSCVAYLREKEKDGSLREKEENGALRENKKDRIRYIDDSHRVPTFGENIYELLKNSFDLQKGEMGALAQRKIETVIQFLTDTEKKLSDNTLDEGEADRLLKDIDAHRVNCVNLLADGMVRGKLERELNRLKAKLQSRLSIDAQIKLHEEILKKLRNRKAEK